MNTDAKSFQPPMATGGQGAAANQDRRPASVGEPRVGLAVSMQPEAPLTLLLSPLRAGRGEIERTCLGSLFAGPVVPDILASHLRVHSQARSWPASGAGFDPGILRRVSGKTACRAGRAGSRPVSFLSDDVRGKLPAQHA